LMHPGNRIDVQARFALAVIAVVPRPLLQPPAVVAGAEHEDVALAEADTLRLLGSLELFPRHRLAGLEVRDPAQARDVEENSAADDAVGVGCDVESVHAVAGHLGDRPS